MLSRIWLINSILALMVVLFGLKAYGVWVQGNEGHEIPQMVQKPTQRIAKPSKELYEIKILPESKYDVLMSLNLFAPERTEIIPEKKNQAEQSKKLSVAEQKNLTQYLSQLTLYGMVITNDLAEALVSYSVKKLALKGRTRGIRNNPRVNRKSPKQTKWIKAGDKLGDFKVVSIEPDRVLLKAGDQSYDLLLYDKENIKKRRPAKPKPGPNVVGVTVAPKAEKVTAKNRTIPSAPNKDVAPKPFSKAIPQSMQKNLKKTIEKK